MSVELIENVLDKVLAGDISARVDEKNIDKNLKGVVSKINNVLEKLSDIDENAMLQKRAHSFLKFNPQGITVLAADKHRLDLNKEYERIWRGGYEELMAKKLYDFNITITSGADFYASFASKKPEVSDMEIAWDDGTKSYLRLFQTPILNDNGEIDVNYYIYQDLTEQQEKLSNINKLQKRAVSFLKSNPQGITILAADKHRLDLNKEYEKIWKGSYEELMAKKLYDFNITITGGAEFYASYQSKKNEISDMEIAWDDGSKSYLRLFQTPILNDEGEIDVNYYIYQDLTEQQEKLNNINKLQRRADSFLKSNPQGITILAADKHRLDLNKEYEKIWKGSYEELMAKKLYDFNITITGGAEFYASYQSKRNEISDMEIAWDDGSKSYLRLFQTPILNDEGEIDVNYYIYQDLTEQHEEYTEIKKLQKRANAFINQNPQGITVLAADKHRLDLNKEYEKIWRGGYEELMAKKLYDFNITITGGAEFYASYQSKRDEISDMEIAWNDGSKSYLRLFQTPILNDDGEIDVNYYIYQDLTEQRHLAKYLDEEVDKVAADLQLIADGDPNLKLEVGEGNQYTKEAKEQFIQISSNVAVVRDAIINLVNDTRMLADAGIAGKTDVRADALNHRGFYREVIEGVDNMMDAIIAPMIEAMNISVEFANNNYTARFDETIPVAGQYIQFKEALNNVGIQFTAAIKEVREAVEEVEIGTNEAGKGSDEVAKAAEGVATASQQCADLTKKLLSRMEDINGQVGDLSAGNEEVASTSQEVLGLVKDVTEMGHSAQGLGNDANNKMIEVEKIAQQSVEEINGLNDQMKDINNIVRMITEITNQINLLALNAAIEAARAGEHGRGFAVVAGEVKNLAGEAREATNHIDNAIGAVQKRSEKTANAINSANAEITSGVESVNKTIEALNRIIRGTDEAANAVDEIAKAIEDQAAISNKIVLDVDEGTKLTKDTEAQVEDLAAIAEEASASSEEIGSVVNELGHMAKELEKSMDKFRI